MTLNYYVLFTQKNYYVLFTRYLKVKKTLSYKIGRELISTFKSCVAWLWPKLIKFMPRLNN